MRPARGKVLVKRVETEETLPGGHIIFTQRAQAEWAQWQVEVIAVGEPSVCAKHKKCSRPHWFTHELDISGRERGTMEYASHVVDQRLTPGAWCIIRHRSLVPVGSDDKRFLCNQEDVLGIFTDAPPHSPP